MGQKPKNKERSHFAAHPNPAGDQLLLLARAIHGLALRLALPLSAFHRNTFLAFYFRQRNAPAAAFHLFDAMPDRNPIVVLCYRNLETAQHLFKDCPFTREVWDRVATRLDCSQLFPTHNSEEKLIEWWEKRTLQQDKRQTKGLRSLHMLLCWEVWCERNRRVFKDTELSMLQLVAKVLDEVQLWSACGAKDIVRIAQ
uniref:Reverse transcriptase zinc-binding domain-containing protein n=1 Tax=Oryza rufipogon TaxID=4529 RepID=A0A0E0Q608_ORYRU